MTGVLDVATVNRRLDDSQLNVIRIPSERVIPESSPYTRRTPAFNSSPTLETKDPQDKTSAETVLNDSPSLSDAFTSRNGIAPVSRVGQLDAEQLDGDVVHMVALQLRHATSLVDPEVSSHYP